MAKSKCICEGNWRQIIAEEAHKFGNIYEKKSNNCPLCGPALTERYTYVGILWAEDDFYYAMRHIPDGKLELTSCVGRLKDYGYKKAKTV